MVPASHSFEQHLLPEGPMCRVLGTQHPPDTFLLSGSSRLSEGGTPKAGEHVDLLQPQGEEEKGELGKKTVSGKGEVPFKARWSCGLLWEAAFELRHKRSEGKRLVVIQKIGTVGRGHSKCKGSGAGVGLEQQEE